MKGKSRREQLEELLAQDQDDDGFLRYGLAMEYKSAGDLGKAVECFRTLLGTHPEHVPGYMQLGQLLNQVGDEDEARTIYRKGIAVAQKKGDAHAAGEMSGFLAMLE
jgi:Flp pilus assembly protein TadD